MNLVLLDDDVETDDYLSPPDVAMTYNTSDDEDFAADDDNDDAVDGESGLDAELRKDLQLLLHMNHADGDDHDAQAFQRITHKVPPTRLRANRPASSGLYTQQQQPRPSPMKRPASTSVVGRGSQRTQLRAHPPPRPSPADHTRKATLAYHGSMIAEDVSGTTTASTITTIGTTTATSSGTSPAKTAKEVPPPLTYFYTSNGHHSAPRQPQVGSTSTTPRNVGGRTSRPTSSLPSSTRKVGQCTPVEHTPRNTSARARGSRPSSASLRPTPPSPHGNARRAVAMAKASAAQPPPPATTNNTNNTNATPSASSSPPPSTSTAVAPPTPISKREPPSMSLDPANVPKILAELERCRIEFDESTMEHRRLQTMMGRTKILLGRERRCIHRLHNSMAQAAQDRRVVEELQRTYTAEMARQRRLRRLAAHMDERRTALIAQRAQEVEPEVITCAEQCLSSLFGINCYDGAQGSAKMASTTLLRRKLHQLQAEKIRLQEELLGYKDVRRRTAEGDVQAKMELFEVARRLAGTTWHTQRPSVVAAAAGDVPRREDVGLRLLREQVDHLEAHLARLQSETKSATHRANTKRTRIAELRELIRRQLEEDDDDGMFEFREESRHAQDLFDSEQQRAKVLQVKNAKHIIAPAPVVAPLDLGPAVAAAAADNPLTGAAPSEGGIHSVATPNWLRRNEPVVSFHHVEVSAIQPTPSSTIFITESFGDG